MNAKLNLWRERIVSHKIPSASSRRTAPRRDAVTSSVPRDISDARMVVLVKALAAKVRLELLAKDERSLVRVPCSGCSHRASAWESHRTGDEDAKAAPWTSHSPSRTTLMRLTALRDGSERSVVPRRTGSCVCFPASFSRVSVCICGERDGATHGVVCIDGVDKDLVFAEGDFDGRRAEEGREHGCV